MLDIGAAYVPPARPEVTIEVNAGWKFRLDPGGSPQTAAFDDATWAAVTLPHTWNGSAVDPKTGDGWYRKTLDVPASMTGRTIYLHFLGACLRTTVYVDGRPVGSPHTGGWEAFDVDVTDRMTAGPHRVAIEVSNTTDDKSLPAGGGDYVKQGGLYRDVSLVAVPKTHVAVTEPVTAPDASGRSLSGAGVYFSHSTVALGAARADVRVKTVLDNLDAVPASVSVTSYLVDGTGVVRAEQASTQALAAAQRDVTVTQAAVVDSPRLWNGRSDPYLYDLYVEVRDRATDRLLDLSHQRVGIRSFRATTDDGFILNGRPYPLVGVNMHQDSGVPSPNGGAAGWSQSIAQQRQDIDQALDLGVTILRTAHYQREPAFYEYCDQKGLILETEYGQNDAVPDTRPGSDYVNSVEDRVHETTRQTYNHPSVVFWSDYNEIPTSLPNGELVGVVNGLIHAIDDGLRYPGTQGRYTVAETHLSDQNDSINTSADIGNPHYYNGWYDPDPASEATQLDAWHADRPKQPVGVGEYGAGGSAFQYQIDPPNQIASTSQVYHPRNGQTLSHMEQWAAISSKPYVLDAMVWSMFDFTSHKKNEGDGPNTNDKGLITRDRRTKKDAYYFYKANWNKPGSERGFSAEPVLWVSDHDWTDRHGPRVVTVTAFSNIGPPTLTLNGGAHAAMTQLVSHGLTVPDAYTLPVTLADGANDVRVDKSYDGVTHSNGATWTYHAAALAGTPFARVDFTDAPGAVQPGYAADTGQAFGQQDRETYGWVNADGVPSANTAGTYHRTENVAGGFAEPSARTGIVVVPGTNWRYRLPNGSYDVRVVAADPGTSRLVNNLTLNDTQLQATAFTTSGGTYEAFYARVDVKDGLLTLSAGPGMVVSRDGPRPQGRLAAVDINVLPPAVLPPAAPR